MTSFLLVTQRVGGNLYDLLYHVAGNRVSRPHTNTIVGWILFIGINSTEVVAHLDTFF
jgi:hypothetical protein